VSKEQILVLNQRFFPERDYLKIYEWDTPFSNRFNRARDCYGAYLWSIYDEKRKRITVISVFLTLSNEPEFEKCFFFIYLYMPLNVI